MADADLSVAVAGKNSKTKRDVVPSSSRSRKSSHIATESAKSDSKFKKTVTPVVGTTDVIGERGDGLFPVDEASSDAAEKLLESMLEECLSSKRCAQPREQTEVDLQIVGLAERFQSTLDQLDRMSCRLRDVTFDVEQKRLIDLKRGGHMRFQETFNSDSNGVERDVSNNEQPVREVYNVDLGHSKASGHRFRRRTIHGPELSRQLDMWLSKADLTHGPARAIIAPHAGYSYSGACAAYAYRQISPVVVKRIFILGPSHHVRLGGCALSSMDKYETPLYDLTIDKQIYAELEATRQFEWMDVRTDEDEHSIEMHLPYIAKVMDEYSSGFTIIPVLVGSLSPEKEAKYGSIFAPYLADPQNLFVISSDFCHWGQRFRFTWRDPARLPIHRGIEWLDRQGMDIIEKMDPHAFTEYLNKYSNTICGRHPIGVLLQAITSLQSRTPPQRMSLRFLQYAQSSSCTTPQDSSVSYASASLLID